MERVEDVQVQQERASCDKEVNDQTLFMRFAKLIEQLRESNRQPNPGGDEDEIAH